MMGCQLTKMVATNLLGRAEASPTQVMSIEIFRLYNNYIYIYIYISAVRPSFRIYLSSISTIYNISSVMRMRIRRRGHGRGSEHFDARWRKRANFVTSRDTEKERLRKHRNGYQKFIKESCRDIIAMKLSSLNYEATSQVLS